jgi:hypothetical protein
MSDDGFDDGLVHSHGWATEKPAIPAPAQVIPARREEEYDDGLVHGHDWASTGK